ncbi:MAG: EAL domain-containing protein [Candidatus Nitricoxidivorans perseverans]|uniref:EAL domain-containing protein n=1 Tax=Candidatus Nitricoxidivorans perseverans TaxID=2975601 RepID=A0AA49FLZ5_9PROT|nr:MAG: EAL domain-containing protein [Candidatus Nitricoxidivorans perseverans]
MEIGPDPSADAVLAKAGWNLKRRILLPLGFAFALLVSAFAVSLHRIERNHLAEAANHELATMQASLRETVALRAGKLRTALEMLERDPALRPTLASRDRGLMRAKYGPLFEKLRRDFNITHFYFLDADRMALMRLHQPNRFGDRIDRFTAIEAGRTGRIVTGMELGPLGTLSLRAAMPLSDGGRIVGYVELAEEVLDVVQDLVRTFRSEGFALIHKDMLSRPDWETGMRMLGRQADWERFPDSIMVVQTLPEVPAALGRMFSESEHARLSVTGEIDHGGRIYQAGFIPLIDVAGREVGDLAILRDITTAKAETKRLLAMVVAVSAMVCALTFMLFYLILNRTQRVLAASRERLLAEAQEQARIQFQHMQALIAWADEQERVAAELRIAAIAFESQEGMFVTDPNGVILRINHAFTELTGYSAEEAIGKTPALLKSGHHDEAFYKKLWQALVRDRYWQGEVWNRRKNGEVYPEWQVISAVTDEEGRVTHYVSAFSDITQRKQAEAEIQRLAHYDHLTKLPNRRLLIDRLNHALASSARRRRHGAILFIDLDHFKTLNDTQGHEIGDLLLVEVAQRLLSCVRQVDTVARLGGDEFVVMLEDLNKDRHAAAKETEMIGEKIRNALNRPFTLGSTRHGMAGSIDYQCTASIGAGLFLDGKDTIDDLLKHADVAMYQAKDAGRNAVRFFDPAMQATLESRAAIEADLRRALSLKQFELFYQAQTDGDGRIIGAEALLRWNHPQRGLVPPADFIPLAEETGLIVPIGQWVLETACGLLKSWRENAATRDLRLAVNVSARQFRQPDFVAQARAALARACADPARLELELTESVVLDNVADTIDKMNALKSVGVGFSMDDFGTGHSSLSYLKQLPLDQLKIDRSFVRDIATDPSDAVIVRTIIVMARSLGLDVVAEGVETGEQRDFLERNGCSLFQGYLFSRPLPLNEFGNLLLNR